MPSFYEAMKRIVQGKPVYDVNDPPAGELQNMPPDTLQNPLAGDGTEQPQSEPSQASEQPTIRKNDARTFPVASVKRAITRVNGSDMQVYCYIENHSSEPLDLHKIRMFGKEEELRHAMNPGDDREFLVYEGPRPTTQQDHEVLLTYKTENGDYFEAIHDIRFQYNNADGTFTIDEIHLRLPIRDIYG